LNNRVILNGPYIGNWEQELLMFRPYVSWVHAMLPDDDIFVSSHINRRFLYDWVNDDRFIPVYEMLSREEENQFKNIHKDITLKNYTLLLKNTKVIINSMYEKKKKIKTYTPNYTVNITTQLPLYNKIFKRVSIEKKLNDNIIFIPDIKEQENIIYDVYKHLDSNYNTIIIGDTSTYLPDKNVIFEMIDYFENGYKRILEYITGAKAVICPAGHWAMLANLQAVPVFTWGRNINQYKKNGIYNFDNNCITLATNEDTDTMIIIKMIDFFIKLLN